MTAPAGMGIYNVPAAELNPALGVGQLPPSVQLPGGSGPTPDMPLVFQAPAKYTVELVPQGGVETDYGTIAQWAPYNPFPYRFVRLDRNVKEIGATAGGKLRLLASLDGGSTWVSPALGGLNIDETTDLVSCGPGKSYEIDPAFRVPCLWRWGGLIPAGAFGPKLGRIAAMFSVGASSGVVGSPLFLRDLAPTATPVDPPPAAGGIVLPHRALRTARGSTSSHAETYQPAVDGPYPFCPLNETSHNISFISEPLAAQSVAAGDWGIVLVAGKEIAYEDVRLTYSLEIIRDVAGDWQTIYTMLSGISHELPYGTLAAIRRSATAGALNILAGDLLLLRCGERICSVAGHPWPAALARVSLFFDGANDITQADGVNGASVGPASLVECPQVLQFS